jgi:hypothetical protein
MGWWIDEPINGGGKNAATEALGVVEELAGGVDYVVHHLLRLVVLGGCEFLHRSDSNERSYDLALPSPDLVAISLDSYHEEWEPLTSLWSHDGMKRLLKRMSWNTCIFGRELYDVPLWWLC